MDIALPKGILYNYKLALAYFINSCVLVLVYYNNNNNFLRVMSVIEHDLSIRVLIFLHYFGPLWDTI